MILADSVRAVDQARWSSDFVRPLYRSYCFAQIPPLIRSLLGDGSGEGLCELLLGPLAGRYRKVILLFVDGFGWRFLERYGDDYPFLRRLRDEGMVTKLTSQFPSTTAAHATAIHTGLEVGQSGVYEWFYYEPLLDTLIAPLLFSFAGDREPGTLLKTGISPQELFPRTTVYQALRSEGVKSFVFQSRDITPGPFGDVVLDSAQVIPFATLHDALGSLSEALLSERERSYYFLYFDDIDTAGHHQGIHSPEFAQQVDTCFRLLESILHARLAGNTSDTLLLMTADHGMTEVDPHATIYLNQTLPEIEAWIARNRKGELMVPAGSCRDMFLHIREERLEEARDRLRIHLGERAEVCLVQDLIAEGFFGSAPPSDRFLSRVGNLVILPHGHESVWWYERGRFAQRFYGHHGGLTPQEMETEILALPYG